MSKRIKNYLSFFLKNNTFRNFLYFFLISASLWFLSRLSDPYTYNLQVPVKYYDQDYNAYPSSFNKDTLSIEMEATGFQLLKLKMKKPVYKYQISNRKNRFWNPKEKAYAIKKLLGKEIKILEIKPEKIDLSHEHITHKTVPVKTRVLIRFKPGFKNTSPPEISPEKVTIFGKKELIAPIKQVFTKDYSFREVNKNIKEKLFLEYPKGVKSNLNFIWYKLPVDQLIEEEKKLNIEIPSNRNKEAVLIFPKKALLKYSFFKKDYKKVKNASFRIILDPKGLEKRNKKVKLILQNKPKEILKYQLIPSEATILIKEQKS